MKQQLVLPLELPGAMGRADFLVGPGNAQAVAFIDSWPGWPGPAAALYGPRAAGKSHLAAIWAAKAGAPIIRALSLGEAEIPNGPLVIEDVGPGAPEALLFALLERGNPLLLTAAVPPTAWPEAFAFTLPDLVSRVRALLGFALWAPDEALLMDLAVKLFSDRQISVPYGVIQRMVQSLERSPAAVRDFVTRADSLALARKVPINISLIKELIGDSAVF